jgi:trk system potassium uptake protein TrkH
VKSSFYSISLNDIRISLKDLAAILNVLSFVMLIPIIATFYYGFDATVFGILQRASAFILPAFVLYVLHLVFNLVGVSAPPKTKSIMITVSMTWLIIALVGSLPFMIRGTMDPLDSFFESMSGWSTTGFSMIANIEAADRDILFYRGLSQGVGGLGVISLGMMVMLQGGALALGYSEIGVTKIKPGIRQTIVESWKIYGLYILFGVVMLYIAGMGIFDAVNHSMTAMSTGGFSTHADIGYYDSIPIELTLMVLMTLGMTSFILHYNLFNGNWGALRSDEVRYFSGIVLIAIAVIGLSLWGKNVPGVDTNSVLDILRKTSFQVISGMSTCGFNSINFGLWPDFAKTFMIGLMFIGGMSSSTAGGIRVIRFVMAVHYGLKKLILPKTAVVVMKLDGRALKENIIGVAGYSAIYLSVCIGLGMCLMLFGYGGIDSILTIMSAMGNDGLTVLSGAQWFEMAPAAKLIIIFAMWVGRIEIYPGLLILRALLDKLQVM